MKIIELVDICKTYVLGKTEVNALSSVSIKIKKGEVAAIAGPSGSGKTSLLNILGLIDKPDSGSFLLHGRDITTVPLNQLSGLRRGTIGFVFQTFNLIPVFNAFENVEYPLSFTHASKKARKERVEHLLQLVGISELARHRPYEMSGGQRQRVAIARALVNSPEVVLADEPTANLDSRTGAEILAQMRILNRELQVTFIFASHDPLVLDAVDRTIYLHDGRIVEGDRCRS
ncbi:MAG: ABC transporter ATP-binding protein [Nitrospirae bacterium]|nr:MAG: ABC transporter ATP-binding protein [Nitrospirota bacterium]